MAVQLKDDEVATEISNNPPSILSIMKEFSANCEDASVTVFNNRYRIDLSTQVFYAYNDERLVEIINALTVLYNIKEK